MYIATIGMAGLPRRGRAAVGAFCPRPIVPCRDL